MIKIGDLVTLPLYGDSGIVIEILEQAIDDFELEDSITMLAEVYWQHMGRSRLELVSDLRKIN